jgi:FKBP-type peptidyl-prolyl cis-trans isomerase
MTLKTVTLLATASLFICTLNNLAYSQDTKSSSEIKSDIIIPATPILEKIDTLVGTGQEATIGTRVAVHYSGWLRDPGAPLQHGKAFDNSLSRGPFTFPLGAGRVIKGWDQGVEGMKVGGKRTLIIPAELGYGARGAGNGVIPPNADLIFDVELLNVFADQQINPDKPSIVPIPPIKKIDTKKGSGAEAVTGKNVTVHYTGWLFDAKAKKQKGEKFDSSVGSTAFTFSLGAGHVIKGWDEGVVGMKVGGKRTLIIPAALAYGERGAGNGKIPPNTDLIFDVQLLKVK